jgi:hypothetical protein
LSLFLEQDLSLDSAIPGFTQAISELDGHSVATDVRSYASTLRTAATKWRGESSGYGLALQVLLQRSIWRRIYFVESVNANRFSGDRSFAIANDRKSHAGNGCLASINKFAPFRERYYALLVDAAEFMLKRIDAS